MVPESIPSESADLPVVLVRVASAMGEDKVRIDPLFERHKPRFDRVALFREKAIPERHDFDAPRSLLRTRNQTLKPSPPTPARPLRSIRTSGHQGAFRVPACREASPPPLFQCRPNARPGRGPTTALQAERALWLSRSGTTIDIRPRAPRRLAAFDHFLKHLSVPQRIHGPPKTLVLVRHQVSGFDQPIERLKHQLFTVPDIFKNLLAKDKIAAIDPNI